MKIAVAALAMVCLASPALAISRSNAMDRTCADVQQLIAGEKAVLLSFPSRRGNIALYDRYVTDRSQCNATEYAASTYIPTKDNPSCPVHNCRSASVLQPR
jgi:hypothetical protein